jgi:hypothetical protein
MTELMEKVMGDNVVKMCALLDKTIPLSSDNGKVIEKGFDSFAKQMLVIGFGFGVISTILCIAIIFLLKVKGLI